MVFQAYRIADLSTLQSIGFNPSGGRMVFQAVVTSFEQSRLQEAGFNPSGGRMVFQALIILDGLRLEFQSLRWENGLSSLWCA